MREGPWPARALRIAIAAGLSSSCALLPAMDDFAHGGSVADASAETDSGSGGDASAGGDAGGDASAKPVCTNGRIRGLTAFDATPSAAKAVACDVANALIVDDRVAGLAATDYAGSVLLDGVNVHGCVGVEFEAPTKTVFLRLGAAGSACGTTCLAGFCGQGDDAEVFAGPARGDYHFVSEVTVGSTLAELTTAVPSTTRVVLVCRGGFSKDKDNPVVDAITAACP